MNSLIIDGNNVANACYFVSNPEDINWHTGWVSNKFKSMIQRIERELNATQSYIAWDNGGTKWRKEILPEYKANRTSDKKDQINACIEECQELDFKHFSIEGFEGDDVILALCRAVEGYKTIVSADKDFIHLLERNFCSKLYNPIAKQFREVSDIDDVTMRAIVGNDDNLKGLKGKGKAFVKKYVEGKVSLTEEELILLDKHKLIIDQELNPYKEDCLQKVSNLLTNT